jgi:ketosteroid isomerase-like protein
VTASANVDIVLALQPSGVDLVEVFERGRFDLVPAFAAQSELFDPAFECSFVAGKSEGSDRVTYSGAQGLIDGWRDWLAAWETYWLEVEDFIDAGDSVVVMVRARARTRRGGVEMEDAPATVWTLDKGRVVRIEFHRERTEALAAAGLEVPR